jgi:hypothetical protein
MRGQKIPSGVSYTLRLTPAEMQAARRIGRGNAADGIRTALRICNDREIEQQPVSTILRSIAATVVGMEQEIKTYRRTNQPTKPQ